MTRRDNWLIIFNNNIFKKLNKIFFENLDIYKVVVEKLFNNK